MSSLPRRYKALLVGNFHYPDDSANLPDLKGPLNDLSDLGRALTDSVVGLFDQGNVTIFPERTSREIAAAEERFFNDATRDDVLLFYYSGHGLTNERGDVLLLCGRDSQSELRMSTTVALFRWPFA